MKKALICFSLFALIVFVFFSISNLGATSKKASVKVYYLEIVTPNVNSVCATYEKIYGVKFSKPVARLGNARTAILRNGGKIGIRAPMRKDEKPLVRPYLLVDNIKLAVKKAAKGGGKIAIPPMKIPGHGTFAIFIQNGIEHGIWQR